MTWRFRIVEDARQRAAIVLGDDNSDIAGALEVDREGIAVVVGGYGWRECNGTGRNGVGFVLVRRLRKEQAEGVLVLVDGLGFGQSARSRAAVEAEGGDRVEDVVEHLQESLPVVTRRAARRRGRGTSRWQRRQREAHSTSWSRGPGGWRGD